MVNTGRRASIQRTTGLEKSLLVMPPAIEGAPWACDGPVGSSADADLGVGGEDVVGDGEVERRRTLADAARAVVGAAVAGAEPAVVGALGVARLLPERHAAEVGADAEQHQPLVLLHPGLVRLRVLQLGKRHGAGFL